MPRVISFIVLLAIVLLVGAIFFQVMAQFFVPLFLACVLLVVFEPLHSWMGNRLPSKPRLAAALTTICIILVVVLPLVYLGWKAYVDFHALLSHPVVEESMDEAAKTAVAKPAEKQAAATATPAPATASAPTTVALDDEIDEEELSFKLKALAKKLVTPLADRLNVKIPDADLQKYVELAQGYIAKILFSSVQSIFGIVVGLFILVIALYYFLVDGPAMVEAVMAVSPLDRRYEHELLQRFSEVSRAVVVATLVAALAQGALAGIGYLFALPEQAPLFLLMALTTVCALVPIFGAFAVWGCVCGWLFVTGHTIPAIGLAIYCTIVVSLIDNIMKPLILHGQSKLHPLLALLSILGGIEAFGPVGILVGPMLVSFLQALLNMLRKELDSFGGPVGPSTKPLAESMVEAIQMATGENAAGNGNSSPQLKSETSDGLPGKNPQQADKSGSSRRAKGKR